MAAAKKADEEKKGPSLVIQLALLAGLTVAVAGVGWLAGGRLAPPVDKPQVTTIASDKEAELKGDHGEEPPPTNVVLLDPMTVNLSAPSSVWARLEVSLVFDGPADPVMAETVHQDLLGYLRTVKLQQLKSASGFLHFKSDLQERADIRSGGKIDRVLIKTLLFE